ncbi:ParA family protein [Aeromonas caviae]|uniref:ParA family protein n=1 Tax=Aeromonas caviae TaxID=648 RepID=UPI00191E7558|nr:AAA family ATPase [Aeromonas caviae]MBL0516678.1 AAA family ATPase [Aeromonas caviae]MDX7791961.1 AAA family ATPase [Aeromonas caviae]
MKIITLYNHKGGVSKTTSTFNLASYLAESGKKVLMVDADPQCNLTEIALAPIIEKLDAEAEKSKADVVSELPGTSILDALNQRVQGDLAFIDIDKIDTVEISNNLHLLRGSVDLSSIEDELAEAHIQRLAMRTNLMRTYVATGDFLTRLSHKLNLDYIFIDVGPSSGALTRSFFLVCDAFFIPVAPDRFNVQAVSTLAKIVDRWMSEHALVKNQYEDLGLPIRPGTPAFLGAIVQAFKLYAGEPKPGFRLWMDRLPTEIVKQLQPVFNKHSKGFGLYLPTSKEPVVANIPDFNQLAPLMQEVGKAVFSIEQKDTSRITPTGKPWVGNNWTKAEERMTTYKGLFKEIAGVLEALK